MPDRRRTILFVTGADEWYGSDYVLYEIVSSLDGTEFDAIVLVPDDVVSEIPASQRLSGKLRARGVEVHELPLSVLRRRYMTPSGMARLTVNFGAARRAALNAVRGRQIALVHSHTATVMTGAQVARGLNVPHAWHVSEILERPRIVRTWLARKVVRSSDKVIAVSNAVRAHLLSTERNAADRIEVIYNGVDPARFDGRRRRDDNAADAAHPLVVGMVGRVGTWKGQELLLDAAQIVCREYSNVRFVLAGGVLNGETSALDGLRRRVTELGISDRVAIQEYCSEVPALLREFDIFVQPSLRPDPLPTTILEAMASGIPVVATNHGGAPEMVAAGVTGLLTPPGDARAMAAAILNLLREPALRLRMGAAGRERIVRDFSPAAFSSRYLRVYRELAAGRR
jgi:glycosyltransferase involved in cell wall biosynthesis